MGEGVRGSWGVWSGLGGHWGAWEVCGGGCLGCKAFIEGFGGVIGGLGRCMGVLG